MRWNQNKTCLSQHAPITHQLSRIHWGRQPLQELAIHPEGEPEAEADEGEEIDVSDMSDLDADVLGHDGDSQVPLDDTYVDAPLEDTCVDAVGEVDIGMDETNEESGDIMPSTQLVPGECEGDNGGGGSDCDDDVQCLSPPVPSAEELIAKRKSLEGKIHELSAMLQNAKKIETAKTFGKPKISRIVCYIHGQLVFKCY